MHYYVLVNNLRLKTLHLSLKIVEYTMRITHGRNVQSFPITATISRDLHRVRYDHKYLSTTLNTPASNGSVPTGIKFRTCAMLSYYPLLEKCFSNFLICRNLFQTEIFPGIPALFLC